MTGVHHCSLSLSSELSGSGRPLWVSSCWPRRVTWPPCSRCTAAWATPGLPFHPRPSISTTAKRPPPTPCSDRFPTSCCPVVAAGRLCRHLHTILASFRPVASFQLHRCRLSPCRRPRRPCKSCPQSGPALPHIHRAHPVRPVPIRHPRFITAPSVLPYRRRRRRPGGLTPSRQTLDNLAKNKQYSDKKKVKQGSPYQ